MSSRFFLYRATLCASVVIAAVPGWGAEPLTLAEAQRIAISRSQQLLANELAASAARRMAQAAGQLPDPVLKIGIDNLPVNGPDRFSLTRDFMTMRRIGVMQELPGADKRRLRAQRSARPVTFPRNSLALRLPQRMRRQATAAPTITTTNSAPARTAGAGAGNGHRGGSHRGFCARRLALEAGWHGAATGAIWLAGLDVYKKGMAALWRRKLTNASGVCGPALFA